MNVSLIEKENKALFVSLANNINQGETEEAVYFCSLVNKKGRTISVISRQRMLLLILWKNKTHTIAYLQTMSSFPPWRSLPFPKIEKDLKLIDKIEKNQNTLTFKFKDDEDSWQMEFSNDQLSGQWRQLVRKHSDTELCFSSLSFIIEKFPESNKCEDSQDSLTLKYEESVTESEESFLDLSLNPINSSQQGRETPLEEEEKKWKERENEMSARIQFLEKKNSMLQLQNFSLSTSVKELKEETARLKISKMVLSSFKEEYAKRHEQLKMELFKRKIRERHLMTILSQLTEERKQQQRHIHRLNQELLATEGKSSEEKSPERDVLLEQLTSLITSEEFDDDL